MPWGVFVLFCTALFMPFSYDIDFIFKVNFDSGFYNEGQGQKLRQPGYSCPPKPTILL